MLALGQEARNGVVEYSHIAPQSISPCHARFQQFQWNHSSRALESLNYEKHDREGNPKNQGGDDNTEAPRFGLATPLQSQGKAHEKENPGRSSCKIISFQVVGTGLMCPGTRKNSKHIMTIGPPRGRLIQKHHRQATSLVKTPPRTGPRMVDTIKTPIQLPINTGRLLGSATTLIRITDPPRVPAAPNPWIARPMITESLF